MLISNHSHFMKWYITQFRIFEKNIGKLNFVTIDVDLALKRYRLWSWYYSTHKLHYSFTGFFVFSLLCCKYICDIYLSMLDSKGLCKFNNIFIYKITEDIHSVAVSQRRNDHMQVYIIIMEGKQNFFIWNGLIVDRLTGPKLMSLWNAWGYC